MKAKIKESKVKLWVAQSCMTLWSHGCSLPGDLGLIPGLGRSPGEGKGYPLQYSDLEGSMDCTSWGRSESDTTERLSPSCYLSRLFLLSSGSRSSSIFYYEVGRNHIKAESQIPFQIQNPTNKSDLGDWLAICGWQKMNHCQKDYSPGENCSVSQSLHSVMPIDFIRVSSSDHRALM